MATTKSSSSQTSTSSISKNELSKEIRRHEVAIGELNSLPSSRPVYMKNGNIFFCTTIQTAVASEQRQLDVKSKMQKTNGD